MAFSGDPTNVNVHSGGTGKSAYPIADQFIPEVWGQAILDVFQQTIMMNNLGTDLSSNISKSGDTIHLPHIGVPSLAAFTQGGSIDADVTGAGTETQTDLTLDQYNVSSVYVPDITNVQSSYDLMSIYVKQLAYANARGFDNFLHYQVANNLQGLFANAGGVLGADANKSLHVNSAAEVLSSDNIADLFKIVLGSTGSTDGWNLVLHPDMYSSLAKLTDYSTGTTASLGAGFGRTGNAGQILGMPVWIAQSPYMGAAMLGDDVAADASKGILAVADFETSSTNNNDICYGYAIHDSAMYYAFSKQAKITATYRHSHLSWLVTCESVYGGAFRNADSDGSRRCIAIVDYEAS